MNSDEGNAAASAIALAKRIEREYGVETSVVVENPRAKLQWASPVPQIYVIEPEADALKKFRQISKLLEGPENWFAEIRPAVPVAELEKIVERNPGMLRQYVGPIGILNPFLFQTEVHGNYASRVRDSVGKKFRNEIRAIVKDARKRLHESNAEMARQNRLLKQRAKKFIGPIENKQLIANLRAAAEKIARQDPDLLVALDLPGRPAGLMLKRVLLQSFGKSPQLFFIDPELAKNFGARDSASAAVLERFKQDCPALAARLKGAKVAVIDDQVAKGITSSGVERLLARCGSRQVSFFPLSKYSAEPPPSWWSRKRILGIEHGSGFTSRKIQDLTPREQEKARNFRKHLKMIAERAASSPKRARSQRTLR